MGLDGGGRHRLPHEDVVNHPVSSGVQSSESKVHQLPHEDVINGAVREQSSEFREQMSLNSCMTMSLMILSGSGVQSSESKGHQIPHDHVRERSSEFRVQRAKVTKPLHDNVINHLVRERSSEFREQRSPNSHMRMSLIIVSGSRVQNSESKRHKSHMRMALTPNIRVQRLTTV